MLNSDEIVADGSDRWLLQTFSIRVRANNRRTYLHVDYRTPRKKHVTVSMTVKNKERRAAIAALCAMSPHDEYKVACALRLLLARLGIQHSRMESALRQRERYGDLL